MTYSPTINLIKNLKPETTKIYVIIGDSKTEHRELDAFKKDVGNHAGLIYLTNLSHDRLLETIKGVERDSVIIYIGLMRDIEGNTFIPAEVAKEISDVSPVPIFTTISVFLGKGVIGGYMITSEEQGRKVAEVAHDIFLERANLHKTFELASTGEYIFDWRELKKKAIVWDLYKPYIIGSLFLIACIPMLIVRLRLTRAEKREFEERINKAFELNPCMIIITSYEDEIILDGKLCFFDITGYTREELIGKTTIDLGIWSVQDRTKLIEHLKEHEKRDATL